MLRSLLTTIKVLGTVLLFLALERVCAWSGSIFHADGMTGGSAAIHSGSNYHIAPDNPGFDPIYHESDEPPWWGPPGMDPFEEEYYYRYRRPPPPLAAMWEQTGHNLGMPPPFHDDPHHHNHYYPEDMEYRRMPPDHPLEQGGSFVSRLVSGRTVLDVVDAVVVQSTTRSPDGSSASSSTTSYRPYSPVGSQTQPDSFRKEPPRVQANHPTAGSGDPASSSSAYRTADLQQLDNGKQRAFAAYDMRQRAAADFDRNRRNRENDDKVRRGSGGRHDESSKFALEKKDEKKEKRQERKERKEGSSFGGIKEKIKSKLSDSKGIVKGRWKNLAVAFKGSAAGVSNQIKNLASQVKSTDRTWGDSGDVRDTFYESSSPSEPPSLSQAYTMYGNKASIAPSPAAQVTTPTRTTVAVKVPATQSKAAESTKVSGRSPTPSATTSRPLTTNTAPAVSTPSSSQPSLSRAYSVYDTKGDSTPSPASVLGQRIPSETTKVVPSSQQSSFVTSDAAKSSYSSSSSSSPFSSGIGGDKSQSSTRSAPSGSSGSTSTSPASYASSTVSSGPVASSQQKGSYSAFGATKPKSPEKYNPFNPWNPQGSGDTTKSEATPSSDSAKASTSYSSSTASTYSAFGSTKPTASEASNPFSSWNPQVSSSASTTSSSTSSGGKRESSSSNPSSYRSETLASTPSTQQQASYSAFGGGSKPKAPETSNPFSPWNPQGSSASTSTTTDSSNGASGRGTSSGSSASSGSSNAKQKPSYSAFDSKPKSPEKYNPFNPWNPQGSAGDRSSETSSRRSDETTESSTSSPGSYTSNSPSSSPAKQQKSSFSAFGSAKPKVPEASNPFSPWNPQGSASSEATRHDSPSTSSSDRSHSRSDKTGSSTGGTSTESDSKASERYNPFNPWNPSSSTSTDAWNSPPTSVSTASFGTRESSSAASSSPPSTASQKSSFSAFGSAKPKAPQAPNPFSPWNPQEATSSSTWDSSGSKQSSTPTNNKSSASSRQSSSRDSSNSFDSQIKSSDSLNPFSPWNPQTASASGGANVPEPSGRESSAINNLESQSSIPTPSARNSWSSFGSKPKAPASNHALGGWNAAHTTSSFPTPAVDDDATSSLNSVRNTPTQLGASNSPSASNSPPKSYSGFGNKPRAPASSHSLGGWVDHSSSRGQVTSSGTSDGSSRSRGAETAPSPFASSSSSTPRTSSDSGETGVGGAGASFLPSEPVPSRTYSSSEGVMSEPGYGNDGVYSPQMARSSSDRLDRASFGVAGEVLSSSRESRYPDREGEPPSLAKTFVNFDNKPREMNTRHLLDGEPPSLAKSFAYDNRPRPAESLYGVRERYIPSPATMDYGSSSNHFIAPEPSRTEHGTFDSSQTYTDVGRPMDGSSNAPSWVQSGVKSPTFYSSTPTPASAHSEEGYTAASPSSLYSGSSPASYSVPYATSFASAPPMSGSASRVEPVQPYHSSSPVWTSEGSSSGNVPAWVKGGVSDKNFFTSTPSHSSPSSGNSASSPVYSPPSIATPIQRSVAPAINYGSSPSPTNSPSPSMSGFGSESSSSNKMSFDSWAVEGSNAPTWVTNGVTKANFYSPAPSMLSTSSASPSPARSIRGKAPEAARQFTGDWDAVVSTNTPTWVTGGVSKENFYSPAPSNSAPMNSLQPRSSSSRQSSVTKADGWSDAPNGDYSGEGDVFLTGPFSRSSRSPAPSPRNSAPPSPSIPEKRFDKDGAYPTASNSYGSLAPFSVPPRGYPQPQNRDYDEKILYPYGDSVSATGFLPLDGSRDPLVRNEDVPPEYHTNEFATPRRWESAAPTPSLRESLDGAYPTNTNSYGGSVAPYARSNHPDSRVQDSYERASYGRSNGYTGDRLPQYALSSGGLIGTERDSFQRDGVRGSENQRMHVDSTTDFLNGHTGGYDSSLPVSRPTWEMNGKHDHSFLPQTMGEESSYSTRSPPRHNSNGPTNSFDGGRLYGDSPRRDGFSRSSSLNGYQPLTDDAKYDRDRQGGHGYGTQASTFLKENGAFDRSRSDTSTRSESSEYRQDSSSRSWSGSSQGSSSTISSNQSPGRSEGDPKNYQAFGRTVSAPERHTLGGWTPGQASGSSGPGEGGYESSSSRGDTVQSSRGGTPTSTRDETGRSSGSTPASSSSSGFSSPSSATSSSASSMPSSSSTSSSSSSSSSSSVSPPASAPAPSRPKSYSAFGSKPKAPTNNGAFGGSGGYLSGF